MTISSLNSKIGYITRLRNSEARTLTNIVVENSRVQNQNIIVHKDQGFGLTSSSMKVKCSSGFGQQVIISVDEIAHYDIAPFIKFFT